MCLFSKTRGPAPYPPFVRLTCKQNYLSACRYECSAGFHRSRCSVSRRVLFIARRSSYFSLLWLTCLAACNPLTRPDSGIESLHSEISDWQEPWVSSGASPSDVSDAAPAKSSGAVESVQEALANDVLIHRISVDAAQVSLASLMFLLAREAELDLVLQSPLNDPVTYRARDLPLRDVLDVLTQQVPFDWHITDRTLRVRDHSMFSESYPVDYLDMDRSTHSRVGLATRVGTLSTTAFAGDTSSSVANGSETLIENRSDHRFWESLADDLEGLLQTGNVSGPGLARFSLNREAGLVTIHAGPPMHRKVRRYLDHLHESVGRQVLIEASVVEITLSDTYETGIDWQLLANGINGVSAAQVLGGLPVVNANTVSRLSAPSALVSLVQQTDHGDVTATLSLLEEFGDVRILSRPRIIALNNQASVLKVVDNRVYFTVNVERRIGEDRDEIVTESDIHTVPVGLVMNVTPQIGRDEQVMLNVRPTLSRILGFVDDPNPELAAADVRNSVPEIQVRELESMLSVQSGRVAIIGGLMQNASRARDRGVAGLAGLPIVGPLFSQRRHAQERSELLIVLRPTVLDRNDSSNSAARSDGVGIDQTTTIRAGG